MRVALVGNLANVAYERCRALRTYTDVEADLFVNEAELQVVTSTPPVMEDWVKVVKAPFRFPLSRTNANLAMGRKLRKYDLIESYCLQPAFIRKLGVPYISFATGSDLGELALQETEQGLHAKKIFENANLVLYSPEWKHVESIRKLGLKQVRPYKHLIDTDFFTPPPTEPPTRYLAVFHPTRLDWAMKRNNVLLAAFADFLLESNSSVYLVCIQHKDDPDTENTLHLAKELGIDPQLLMMNGCSRDTLRTLYQAADIVADQFKLGLGLVSFEGLASGKPVLVKSNMDIAKTVYGDDLPPIMSCETVDEITTQLQNLTNPIERGKWGSTGRRWVVRHHSPKAVVSSIMENYEAVLRQ